MNQNNQYGERHGYWEDSFSKGNYINGLKEGYWEEYYSDGSIACKGNFKNDLHYGYWEQYPMTNTLLLPEDQFTLRKIFIL